MLSSLRKHGNKEVRVFKAKITRNRQAKLTKKGLESIIKALKGYTVFSLLSRNGRDFIAFA